MRVRVEDVEGRSIWGYGDGFGETATSYVTDGTQAKIIAALVAALAEARGQSGGAFQIADVVADIRPAAAEVQRDVPIAGVRNDDSGR
jgi:hypothetical protein